MMQSLQTFHFRYAKCQGGDLHAGQTLNLVCVDEKCDHRGLVCPVCKMQSHNECHILPIKIFLAQIRDLLANTHDSDQLNNLGAYLRTLDSTKKEMLTLLKEQINQIAQLYKDLEIKIESTYYALRRNILIQSTLTTKLPELLEGLMTGNYTDSFNLQKEFSKYCELIKYREGKPKVTDKSLALVQHYRQLPEKVKTLMTGSLTDYRKKLQEATQKIETEQNTAETIKEVVEEEKVHKICFSDNLKSTGIDITPNLHEVWLKENIDQGFACLETNFTEKHSSASLEILGLGEENLLMIGIGTSAAMQDWDKSCPCFEDYKEQLLAYVHADGGSNKVMNYDEEDEDQPFFFGTGNKITVTVDWVKNQCIFKNSELEEPFLLPIITPIKGATDLKLCIGLSSGDRVRIIPTEAQP